MYSIQSLRAYIRYKLHCDLAGLDLGAHFILLYCISYRCLRAYIYTYRHLYNTTLQASSLAHMSDEIITQGMQIDSNGSPSSVYDIPNVSLSWRKKKNVNQQEMQIDSKGSPSSVYDIPNVSLCCGVTKNKKS